MVQETYEQGHGQPSFPTQDVCWSMQDPWLPCTSRAAALWLPFCFIPTATLYVYWCKFQAVKRDSFIKYPNPGFKLLAAEFE